MGQAISQTPLQPPNGSATMADKQRIFLLALRQVLIMALGAVEDYLELDRSIVPKHKRVNA